MCSTRNTSVPLNRGIFLVQNLDYTSVAVTTALEESLYVSEDLKKLAYQLNAKSDLLNPKIAAANDELKELNLGISAWVGLSAGKRLGYARVDGTWQLAVQFIVGAKMEEMALIRASRELRLESLDSIPALLFVLRQKAQEWLDNAKSL